MINPKEWGSGIEYPEGHSALGTPFVDSEGYELRFERIVPEPKDKYIVELQFDSKEEAEAWCEEAANANLQSNKPNRVRTKDSVVGVN